ncbi:adenylosuccinate lyase family protein [Nesterenkonia halophila]|uniref:lyase family protein n=1 Tax=Nesterenkonia halophila TaxID=302044 RepID=UPI0012908EC9|nr:lyase family protein [Nesterenkonia halophila]
MSTSHASASASVSGTADVGLLRPASAGSPAAAQAGDAAVLQAMLDVEAAWSQVLGEQGVIDPADAAAVARRARAEDFDLAGLAAASRSGGNPVIPLLAELRAGLRADGAARAGETLHLAATSQDVLDTALLLVARRTAAALRRDLHRAAAALDELAGAHRDTLCVARSLTQHALPTVFGLRAAQWLRSLAEAAEALDVVTADLPLQWGGAAGTQAALTDRLAGTSRAEAAPESGSGAAPATGVAVEDLVDALAERLGLRTPSAPWHTARAPITRLGSALAEVTAATGTMAADVLQLARPEIAEVREPAGAGRGGSSAMPQKRNPVLSVLLRETALEAPHHLARLVSAAGTAVDERPDGAWHAEWTALQQLLQATAGAAAQVAELAEGMTVDAAAMRANLTLTGEGLLGERLVPALAELLDGGREEASALIRESAGVDDADSAHGALRDLVRRRASADRLEQAGLDAAGLDALLDRLLDPADYLGRAPEMVDRLRAEAARRIRDDVPDSARPQEDL